MSIHSQRKGRQAETELAAKLTDIGFPCRRTSAQYLTGSQAPDVSGIDGLHIEAKRVERLNITQALQQSIRDADDHEVPVLAHRRNREPWLITVRLDDIHRLAEIVLEQRESIPF